MTTQLDDATYSHTARAAAVLAQMSTMASGEMKREHELVADLGIDSTKALELLVELEDALGVEISDDEAAGMNCVGDVLDYAAKLDQS